VQAVATTGTNVSAGTSGGGVFLSTNNGGSWVAVNSGLPNLAVTALRIDGSNLFAATGAGVFRRPLAEMIAPWEHLERRYERPRMQYRCCAPRMNRRPFEMAGEA
jgi:hypothetical protein